MITTPATPNVYLAPGVTDMRKSIDGLSLIVSETLSLDPFSESLFAVKITESGVQAAALNRTRCYRSCYRFRPVAVPVSHSRILPVYATSVVHSS